MDEVKKDAPVRRRKRGISKKKVIIIVVLLIVLAAAGYFLTRLFAEEELPAITEELTSGSLERALSGTGVTVAADTVSYSLPSMEAAVSGWYAEAGAQVTVGELLFEQDDSEVDDLIADYEDQILEYEVEIEELKESLADATSALSKLTVTAPFSGRISGITLEAGDDVTQSRSLATVTDDSKMKLTQYFSYIYESSVSVGMTAEVSVPSQMLTLAGTVAAVDHVDYVTDAGMHCFAVTVEVQNPGSLTAGDAAGCTLTAADGSGIYPATQNEQLEYAAQKEIKCEANGTLLTVKAKNYDTVTAGEVLFTIESSSYETQIASFEKQISTYESRIEALDEDIADAEESREEYKRYSEIDGKIVSASYETMRNGMVTGSVSIYNLDSMTVSVDFDELDVDRLSVGMPVSVYRSTSSGTQSYEAEITYISLEASNSNGVATFAGTITVYSNGDLAAGVNVSYTIDMGGDSSEGVLAPVGALRSLDDGYYLIIKRDSRPDNALEVDEDYPDGYYAVPVEVGSASSGYIRIESGAEAGETVFLRYQRTAPSGGDSTSSSGETQSSTGDAFAGMSGMPDFSGMSGMPNMSGGMGGMPSGSGSRPSGFGG